ncbi:MAG TPA: carboxypeptidase-like regulatory domain-containing protein [Thermoanaerobaculia bacterium]|nr:carboxypeptidase-like regulatory domain-containing protein [Thermoanaerobaculia bacterium]
MAWDVVVRHRAAIAGRVTEASSGKPLPGARVEITAAPPAFQRRLALQAQAGGAGWPALAERPDRTQAALDGHFHFLDLPAGAYTLTATLPGGGSRYGQASAPVTLTLDGQGKVVFKTVDLAIPATVIKGKVVDGDANAVPMAQVLLRGSGESTYSDAQGRYSLAGLEAGARELVVAARGFALRTQAVTLAQPGAVADVQVTLQPM